MQERVMFDAALASGGIRIVSGERLRCGMVIHRAVDQSFFRRWTVSDPVSGAIVCDGKTKAGTLAKYKEIREHFGEDWDQKLSDGRVKIEAEKAKLGKRGNA